MSLFEGAPGGRPRLAAATSRAHPTHCRQPLPGSSMPAEIDDYDEQIKELINKIQSALENDLPNLKGNERNEVRRPTPAAPARTGRGALRNAHPRARRPLSLSLSLVVASRKSSTSRAASTGCGRSSTASRSSCASCPRSRAAATMTYDARCGCRRPWRPVPDAHALVAPFSTCRSPAGTGVREANCRPPGGPGPREGVCAANPRASRRKKYGRPEAPPTHTVSPRLTGGPVPTCTTHVASGRPALGQGGHRALQADPGAVEAVDGAEQGHRGGDDRRTHRCRTSLPPYGLVITHPRCRRAASAAGRRRRLVPPRGRC